MAKVRVELSNETIELIKSLNIKDFDIKSDEFTIFINSAIVNGIKSPLSKQNDILLKNIIHLAKISSKEKEIQEEIKKFLKNLNTQMIDKI